MHLWEILGICCIIFVLLEIFIPSMFFLNFALGAAITAIISVYTKNLYVLIISFVILSFLSFGFLRPILVNRFAKSKETGVNSKYIGKIVKAESDIDSNNGTISIYDERWNARSMNGEFIPQGANVKIVSCESIIMFVEKCE